MKLLILTMKKSTSTLSLDSVSISKVEVGYSSICAIDTNQKLWCWGQNSHGKSGTGTYDSVIEPDEGSD